MKCPLIKSKNLKLCGAIHSAVLLSSVELSTYCNSADHTECPVYRIFNSSIGRKLTLREYYAAQFLCEDMSSHMGVENVEEAAV